MIDKKKIEEAAENYSDSCEGNYISTSRATDFKAGINWFKENIWHGVKENPTFGGCQILLEQVINGKQQYMIYIYNSSSFSRDMISNYVTRWLYIEDLMKEEEEETHKETPLACRVYKYKYLKNHAAEDFSIDYVCARDLESSLKKFKDTFLSTTQLKIIEITLVVDKAYLRGINDLVF